MPLRIFVTSSRKDESLRDALLEHLATIQHIHDVDVWTEDRIKAGYDWHEEITAAIRNSNIGLILLSASFLASSFGKNVAFSLLLSELAAGGITLVPILLRPCAWEDHPVLGKLKPLPKSRLAVASHTGSRRDEVLLEICKELRKLALFDPTEFTLVDAQVPTPVPVAQLLRDLKHYSEPKDPPPRRIRERSCDLESTTHLEKVVLSTAIRPGSISQVTLKLVDPSSNSSNGVFFRLRSNPTQIGRSAAVDIVIDDPGVSRLHAEIEFSAGRLFLRDMGSANGTLCNGQVVGGGTLGASRVTGEVSLKANDIIRFGARVHALVLIETTINEQEGAP